jgi:hypothetical protein
MPVNEEPKEFYLPPSLWGGPHALVEATHFSLTRIAYETLSGASEHGPDHLLLEGGISMQDEEVASEIKYAKVVHDYFLACQSYVAPRAVRTSSYCRCEECRLVTTLFEFTCATPYPHTVISSLPCTLLHHSIDVLGLSGLPEIAVHFPSDFGENTN